MRHEKVKKICKECKKEYLVHYYRKDNSNFCCFKCMNNNKIGKPSWNKGLTKKTDKRVDYKRYSFKKGNIPWSAGVPRTLTQRINDSLIKKPREKFDGFIETENRRIRKSGKYVNWRNNVFKKFNYNCVICNSKNKNLNAHHLNNFHSNKNNFDLDNGVVLCKKHHLDFHKKYGFFENNEEQFIDYFGDKLLEKYCAIKILENQGSTLAGTDFSIFVTVE
jgi:predicted restriction endonuclease